MFLWISSPDSYTDDNLSPWRRIVQGIEMIGLNETLLRMEFEELRTQACIVCIGRGSEVKSTIYRTLCVVKEEYQ